MNVNYGLEIRCRRRRRERSAVVEKPSKVSEIIETRLEKGTEIGTWGAIRILFYLFCAYSRRNPQLVSSRKHSRGCPKLPVTSAWPSTC